MPDYLLDTNILIEILRNSPTVLAHMRAAITAGRDVQINALSYYETRRGLLNTLRADKLRKFDAFCRVFGIVHLDQAALDRASEIYADLEKKGELIEDADILIAGMALVNHAVLVTDDISHFKRVVGLALENWMK
ncbi:MAG: type II toxin-antitoxin system VapC family toxin [Candidatus Acetothermia bacterium]|jgi:tRNA(fMet)-specific endonuclease VapC|nr:type II toxin-antitoxin system VapC family toxin [Candidatus Acetothermia bacterium]MDH7505200.1 type II toxin-antitoxin system VapC family toxin [Candidatus Acetothermia bacterium]